MIKKSSVCGKFEMKRSSLAKSSTLADNCRPKRLAIFFKLPLYVRPAGLDTHLCFFYSERMKCSIFKRIYFLLPILFAESSWALHVMVDPGHGGNDSGAFYQGLKESDVVLDVSQKLINLLESNPLFSVSTTRVTDQFVSLKDRVHQAELRGSQLFVSLHANSASDARAKGFEVYFQNSLPPDEETLYLANLENSMAENRKDLGAYNEDSSSRGDVAAIVEDLKRQKRLSNSLKFSQSLDFTLDTTALVKKQTIKQAPFYVVSKTSMPSVLIEIGFLTNPKEAQLLGTADYRDLVAQNIYKALIHYKENLDNP